MANKKSSYFKPPKLSWPAEDYNPGTLQIEYRTDELMQEYKRLRRTAMNRIRRLEKAGFGDSKVVQYNRKYLVAPSTIDTSTGGGKWKLAYALTDAKNMLSSEYSTVRAQREMMQNVLSALHKEEHEGAYDFITADNLQEFYDFMSFIRKQYSDGQASEFDSDAAVALFRNQERLHITKSVLRERYMEYVKHAHELDDVAKYTRDSGVTRNEYWGTLDFETMRVGSNIDAKTGKRVK